MNFAAHNLIVLHLNTVGKKICATDYIAEVILIVGILLAVTDSAFNIDIGTIFAAIIQLAKLQAGSTMTDA